MRLAFPLLPACAALAVLAAPASLHPQSLETATIRGTVVDAEGRPVPDVQIEAEYKGETRSRIARTFASDKKGAFIRAGLRSGPWTLRFTKAGFQTKTVQVSLSGGGVSEIPPVTMAAGAPAATGAAGAAALSSPSPAPGAVGPSAADRAKALSESYRRAVEAMQAGRAQEAEAMFRALAAELPTLAEVRHNLGYLAAQRGDHAAAEAEFRKAIELQPGSSESYIALAALLDRTKRSEEGLKLLTDASAQFEKDARFQFALGAAAFNAGKNTEAEQAFLRAVELDSTQAEGHFFLASIAVGRNNVPAAIGRLEKYLSLAPPEAANLAAAKALLATLKARK